MSRTVSVGMAAHLAGTTHSRCRMLRLILRDGTQLGFTDHDAPLAFNLGDGGGELIYSPAAGMFGSDIAIREGFEVDNFEATGPLGEIITRVAVMGGRFNRADVHVFEVNWMELTDGPIRQLAGNLGDLEIRGSRFIFGVRGITDRYNQVIGRVLTNLCSADHGDTQCGRTVESVDATVSAVTDDFRFSVTFAGTFADDYFNTGKAEFTGGALAGILPVSVFDWTGAGAMVLIEPLPTAPEIGDTLTIKRGCPKTRAGCMARNNIARARAFFEVPGTDQALKVPVPGNAGA